MAKQRAAVFDVAVIELRVAFYFEWYLEGEMPASRLPCDVAACMCAVCVIVELSTSERSVALLWELVRCRVLESAIRYG